MIRHSCLCALFLLSVVSAHAEPPAAQPLRKEQLDLAKLDKWGTRSYSMICQLTAGGPVESRSAGKMTFGCQSKDGLVKLSNTTRVFMPDGKRYIEYRGQCVHPKNDPFSTKEINLLVVRSDGVQLKQLRAANQQGKIKIVDKEKGNTTTTEARWPKATVPDISMFYYVTLLPRKAGQRYLIDSYIASSSLHRPERRIVQCAGADPDVVQSGKPTTLFLLYEPGKPKKAIRYWVGADGVLKRVQLNPENRLELISDVKDKK